MNVIQGDLIKLAKAGEFDIIVHGCNCFNIMGGGIAKTIKNEFPQAYDSDCETIAGDKEKIGTYTQCTTDDGLIIINAYTQYKTASSGEDVFEYYGLIQVFEQLYNEYPDKRYGMPKIGCGLANGDETEIMNIIEFFSGKISQRGGTVTVIEYRP
jgi:O-acetyl-ADP-ribose deacetylase (regulator of RNase III)